MVDATIQLSYAKPRSRRRRVRAVIALSILLVVGITAYRYWKPVYRWAAFHHAQWQARHWSLPPGTLVYSDDPKDIANPPAGMVRMSGWNDDGSPLAASRRCGLASSIPRRDGYDITYMHEVRDGKGVALLVAVSAQRELLRRSPDQKCICIVLVSTPIRGWFEGPPAWWEFSEHLLTFVDQPSTLRFFSPQISEKDPSVLLLPYSLGSDTGTLSLRVLSNRDLQVMEETGPLAGRELSERLHRVVLPSK